MPTTSTLFVGTSRIDVFTASADPPLPADNVLNWVRSASESVSTYFGHFPVPRVSVQISTFQGKGIRHGMAFPAEDGGRITIRVGNQTPATEFDSDWQLTHEMIHLGFPSVARRHHWIEEGIATYVEPIARIRAGHMTSAKMWADLIRDMPQGLPESDDRGLDQTHTRERTYWGGAMFCLLADVGIRRETKNTKGLEDALRAILAAGGDIRHSWDLREALKVGDAATGTQVLEKQYDAMKDKPVPIDLDGLWKDLGVGYDGRRVVYNDSAPLASVRRAITSRLCSGSANVPDALSPVIVVGRSVGVHKGSS